MIWLGLALVTLGANVIIILAISGGHNE